MTTIGTGIYFDGRTSARHDVRVELTPVAIRFFAPDGAVLAEWSYDEIDLLSGPNDVLRVGKRNGLSLARLEVLDPRLAADIDERSVPIERSGLTERRSRRKVMGWTIAAAVSMVLMAVFGLPEIATRLAPLVSLSDERKFAELVDPELLALGVGSECGHTDADKPARDALDKLIEQLEAAAALPIPMRVYVVRQNEDNGFVAPGGYIVLYHQLIANSATPDELAGSIAHEIGHIANRDIMRSILHAAGLSFLFGVVLGDFVGASAIIIAAKIILGTGHSREVEAAADAYAVRLMVAIGGDPRALARNLVATSAGREPFAFLSTHPAIVDRYNAINAIAPFDVTTRPLLESQEWIALRSICSAIKRE
jgi:Zn-dependent protease with chaperone function